jgi:hypothetical protein
MRRVRINAMTEALAVAVGPQCARELQAGTDSGLQDHGVTVDGLMFRALRPAQG